MIKDAGLIILPDTSREIFVKSPQTSWAHGLIHPMTQSTHLQLRGSSPFTIVVHCETRYSNDTAGIDRRIYGVICGI